MLTTRKGNKRFAFYDLKLSLAWEAAPASDAGEPAAPPAADDEAGEGADGEPSGGDGGGKEAPVSGEISVAEFGSGSDHDDLEVSVSTSGQCAPFALHWLTWGRPCNCSKHVPVVSAPRDVLQPGGLGSALRMLEAAACGSFPSR